MDVFWNMVHCVTVYTTEISKVQQRVEMEPMGSFSVGER